MNGGPLGDQTRFYNTELIPALEHGREACAIPAVPNTTWYLTAGNRECLGLQPASFTALSSTRSATSIDFG